MLGEVIWSLVIHCLGRHCKYNEDQAQLLKLTPQHSQQMHGKHWAKRGRGAETWLQGISNALPASSGTPHIHTHKLT